MASLSSPPVALAPLIHALLDTTIRASTLNLQAAKATRAFYDSSSFNPVWATDSASASVAMSLLTHATDYGLSVEFYQVPLLRALCDSLAQPQVAALPQARQRAAFDVLLTDAVLRFMLDLKRGHLRPQIPSAAEKADEPSWLPTQVLRDGLAKRQVGKAILAGQPRNLEYQQLQQALAVWLAQPSPPDSAALRQTQYEQIAVNLERWRWEALAPDSAYVLINLPAYELQIMTHDSVSARHRVIIGSTKTPTPTFSSRIWYFTLAPSWNVPRSIATKEMLPRLKQDAGYLASNELALYDQQNRLIDPARIDWSSVTPRNFNYQIRQATGCDNALGNIVFRFANPYSIYVHDTPGRSLFRQPGRALSHGCIRLAEPLALAAYLLRREGRTVELPTEDACAQATRPRDVRLRRPMPIHIRYATCVAEKGRLRFFADIYARDEVIRRQLFAR